MYQSRAWVIGLTGLSVACQSVGSEQFLTNAFDAEISFTADAVARESTTFCSTFHLNGLMHQTRVLYFFAVCLNNFYFQCIVSDPPYSSTIHNVIFSIWWQEHFKAVHNLSGWGANSQGHFPMPFFCLISTATTKYLI